jgi:uncharacterized damage-inducible protein DinB
MMSGMTLAVLIAALALQAPPSPERSQPVVSELATAFTVVAEDLRAAADKMPAERYGYRPAEGVRSFGQVIAHLVGGHFLYCSQAAGRRMEAGLARRMNELRPFSDVATAAGARAYAKEELVPLLAESIEFCRTAYAERGAAAADAATPLSAAAARALVGNVAHDNEHYGNLVTYLRLNGLVPPSTERRASPK